MGLSYQRDDDRQRIVLTLIGAVSAEDLRAAFERSAREGTWKFAVLYDGSAREGEAMSAAASTLRSTHTWLR